jgi:hypothetical protein
VFDILRWAFILGFLYAAAWFLSGKPPAPGALGLLG